MVGCAPGRFIGKNSGWQAISASAYKKTHSGTRPKCIFFLSGLLSFQKHFFFVFFYFLKPALISGYAALSAIFFPYVS